MPRDGSGIYSQPFPDVVEGTTIESAVYNGFTHDVEIDLNTPRPISSGGTGANNAADAMAALGGEGSKIEVLNYDSHNFTAGSFYSKASATNPPVAAHAFAGICYVAVVSGIATSDMFIEVRDRDEATQPGSLFVRQKKNGTWSGWLKAVGTSMSGTPPAAPTDGMFWWDPTRGKLFVWYSDPNTAQWVEAVAVPDMNPDDFVRIDAPQTLTPTQQTQARKNIYAAPFDALAYNGMQVNGSMEVSQELAGGGSSVNSYFCDGWINYKVGTMVLTSKMAFEGYFNGFSANINVTVPVAQSSLGATDVAHIRQPIEGWRVARLWWGTANAQPITIGFWSAHFKTGVYSISVRNGAANRSYVATYTQAVSQVQQYNTVTIPGCTDGVWVKDNTVGLILTFAFASGTTYIAPASNTWYSADYVAAPGQVNGVALPQADAFRLSGFIVLPGIEVPSAVRSPLIMRPFDQELVTCQRYFRWLPMNMNFYAPGAGALYSTPIYFAAMRAVPTMGAMVTNPDLSPSNSNNSGQGYNFATPSSANAYIQAAAAGQASVIGYRFPADARL